MLNNANHIQNITCSKRKKQEQCPKRLKDIKQSNKECRPQVAQVNQCYKKFKWETVQLFIEWFKKIEKNLKTVLVIQMSLAT